MSGGFALVSENGKPLLRLSQDFSLAKAPETYVVLSGTMGVDEQSKVLGQVTRFSGVTTFAIPAGTDLAAFSHVVIWSKKLNVALADAPFSSGEGTMQHDQMKH